MLHIVVGTRREAKLQAVRAGFEQLVPSEKLAISGYAIPSGVNDQPMSLDEMLDGARNRATGAQEQSNPPGDYALGLEGGMLRTKHGLLDTGVIWLIERSTGLQAFGMAPSHQLGPRVEALVNSNVEMSEAVAEVFGTDTLTSRDCSGPITSDVLNVIEFYKVGVIAAYASLQALKVEP